MSEFDQDQTEHDWLPDQDDPDAERFKWGWNAAEGEVVWRVSGPGDGLPAHAEHLSLAWGREPRNAAGDVFGTAAYVPSRASEPAVVVIRAYYGVHVPASVIGWFQEAFPAAQLRGPEDH